MKKEIKKWLVLLLVMTMVVFTLAACGGNEGGISEEGTSAGAVTDTTIRVGISSTPDLDPAVAHTDSSTQAMANLYDTLVFTPADGTIKPRLAESWEASEDGLQYTFKLAEGVKFHDGSEVTAADVKFSMERLLAIGEGYSFVFNDVVDSVEAPSDYEVVFNLKHPHGAFVSSLVRLAVLNQDLVMANIDASGPYGEFGDYGKAWLVTHDAGSGAYKAVELVQQDYFLADRFDDWFMGWEDKPNAPTAFRMLNVIQPSTVRTMMNTRALDITDYWQSTENLNAIGQIEGVSLGKINTLQGQYMYLNTQKKPFDDVNVRRAILCLFDYESIVNDILIGSTLSTGPVAVGVTGHVDCNVAAYDIEKAKDYLAQSSYAGAYQDYTIEMMVNSDVADMEKIGLMFQAAAAQLGIKVEISKAPWVSIVDRMATAETTPHMFSAASALAYNDAGIHLESRYSSKNNGTWEQGEWLQDANLDQMIADALATVDDAERNAKYAAIQNHIVDDIAATGYLCDLINGVAYQSAYVSWPAMENSPDGVVRSVYGFSLLISELEIYPEKKPAN